MKILFFLILSQVLTISVNERRKLGLKLLKMLKMKQTRKLLNIKQIIKYTVIAIGLAIGVKLARKFWQMYKFPI